MEADAQTAQPPAPVDLDRVQVVATHAPQAVDDVPASVSVVSGTDYQTDSRGIDLSEKLDGVPGILARDRQNYAQDEQLSIRGFGARSTFGIRGVRLYIDGIPATLPDGQGQVSSFDLASAARVEVLRGPFSALYGNSSGGVVQMFTAAGGEPAEQLVSATTGSFGTRRASLDARGMAGDFGYSLDATSFQTDGFRDHSAAGRTSADGRFDVPVGDGRTLQLLFNTVSIPEALDPLGLSRDQFQADPTQATQAATDFNTRKSVRQGQAGFSFEDHLDGGVTLGLLAYRGDRAVTQFLAVPVAAQASPLNGGGVVMLATPFGGIDLRATTRTTIAGKPLEWVAGLSEDSEQQHRSGYENFDGSLLGVVGDPRRDEQDRVAAVDQYAQGTWNAGGRWSLFAGLRHSAVRFDSRDHYVTPDNPDDSGHVRFSAITPVAGIDWRVAGHVHVYTSYGTGFETPTFDELGYRPDGGSGLDFALQPARSRNGEAGFKLDLPRRLRIDAALFRSDTRDELAVDSNANGRTTFQNVHHARRQGGEFALSATLADAWRVRFAYTYLDATFRDGFLTCIATPCPVPDVVVAPGTRIPGIPRSFASARLGWGGETGWHAALDARYVGTVNVNNPGTDHASGYGVVDTSVGYGIAARHCDVRLFAGVDNVFDRRYVGSVIVNESNGRYFEPGPGRTWLAGVELRGRE